MGWIFVRESELTWLTGYDKLTLYRSSESVERLFCSVCGCQFTYKSHSRDRRLADEGKGDTIDVALATLDESILTNNQEIVPYRYSWFSDILDWMKGIMLPEGDVLKLERK
jgi:hypothetical protein